MNTLKNWLLALLVFMAFFAQAKEHHHAKKVLAKSHHACLGQDITCAKVVTSAFAPNGDLWRLWSVDGVMFYQISQDLGHTFSVTKQVPIAVENIAARHENRPKIAFDQQGGVYLSWARNGDKRFTGDVRFSYSKDGGKSFSPPVTVNDDQLITGHSFNELLVSNDGDVNIVWLDSRYKHQQGLLGNKVNGSDIYLAQGTPKNNLGFSQQKTGLSNQSIARGTCTCCRIALTQDKQGNLAIFWRHIFGDNIREFALITLDKSRPTLAQAQQISQDHWQIEGCPHQGGAISIDDNNRYHLVWYNQGDQGKGNFYAYSDDAGQSLSAPIAIGNYQRQAAHPYVSHLGHTIDIVWTEFDGKTHRLWHQKSLDSGKTFQQAKAIASSTLGSDRPFIITNGKTNIVSWHRPQLGHWLQVL